MRGEDIMAELEKELSAAQGHLINAATLIMSLDSTHTQAPAILGDLTARFANARSKLRGDYGPRVAFISTDQRQLA